MDDATTELHERFAAPNEELKPEILSELLSILRLHKTSPEELSYKWESYCMKMGAEETKMDLKTTRDFKKDLQENLEQESRGKMHKSREQKRGVGATPRAGVGGGDVFGMYVIHFHVYNGYTLISEQAR
jgi:DNA polymerase alpha subunit B